MIYSYNITLLQCFRKVLGPKRVYFGETRTIYQLEAENVLDVFNRRIAFY